MKQAAGTELSKIVQLDDFQFENAVHVAILRSPVPRGIIEKIEVPKMAKGYYYLSEKDIPGSKTLDISNTKVPVLESRRVHYKGQAIAIIAGPDRAAVSDAVRQCNFVITEEAPDYNFEYCSSSRIKSTENFISGNCGRAHRIVEGEYYMGPQDHYYPEAQAAIAVPEKGKLVVYSSTQWPFLVRDSVAAVLKTNKENVVVRPIQADHHLDGKLWYPAILACHAGMAAQAADSAAILRYSRIEDFLYTSKRAPARISMRAGLTEKGKLDFLEARIMFNTGYKSPFASILTARSSRAALSSYSCKNFSIISRAVESNLPPMGAFTGFGSVPTQFALERLAEDCATACDMDPSEWRAINMAVKGDKSQGSPLKRPIPYRQITDRLLAISDYPRKRSSFELIRKGNSNLASVPGFGIGLAFVSQMAPSILERSKAEAPAVELTLAKDSSLFIKTSLAPESRATLEIWKAYGSSILGIKPEKVIITDPDTDLVPDTGPNTMSRRSSVATKLIISACEILAAKRFREALPITVKKIYRKSGKTKTENPLEGASFGAAVAELELDSIDLAPIVRGIWIVVKAGRILTTEAAMRSLKHDAAQALGLCLGECLDLSGASATENDYWRYKLPKIMEAPPIVVDFLDDDDDPKGLGDLAYSLIPAAFGNALSQALDKPWNMLPLGLEERYKNPYEH